jgi:hypothetical protein
MPALSQKNLQKQEICQKLDVQANSAVVPYGEVLCEDGGKENLR